ncbi:TIR domain-containing protein [Lacinutrix sp. Bg11-31]|uniref:TIR domain-containing protein n=1 Tax=Lacinutrix sp. Bg11-31 TaxID=2057808 RepID=UPI001E55696D|nr:nucleotide-binding protein [Lacinutrix sp. Bg11-31]
MTDIFPKYEVLYSDLRSHYIGYYLASREFKLYMNSINEFDSWKNIFQQVESQRSYISLGTDHEPGDAADTLGFYLNELDNNPELESLISNIIAKFIDFKKEETDFSDIIESIKGVGFSSENIKIIEESFEEHKKKVFPKKSVEKSKTKTNSSNNNNNVFIVHGHNEEIQNKVARVLEKLKLKPVILNEQSNEGLTIIEKFEKHADVSFAIVLLTFDDYGNVKSKESKNKRARQNVILELGYFIAKLGRKNVLPLYENEVELPSDMSGILYTKIDESENWKFRLVKELKSAGFKADANDIL